MKYNLVIDDSKNFEKYISSISLGNSDALEKLYDETKHLIFGFALSILKNVSDAEDVMQDTYVNIYKHANMYCPRSKPLAWMMTITKNLCYDKLKRNKNTISYDNSDLDSIVSLNNNNHDKILIKTIIDSLSEEERMILVLNLVSGFKYHEIAIILNLKLSTVLSKGHRAIKKVRSIYGEV